METGAVMRRVLSHAVPVNANEPAADPDCVWPAYLHPDLMREVDEQNLRPDYPAETLGDGGSCRRVQTDPFDEAAGPGDAE